MPSPFAVTTIADFSISLGMLRGVLGLGCVSFVLPRGLKRTCRPREARTCRIRTKTTSPGHYAAHTDQLCGQLKELITSWRCFKKDIVSTLLAR